MRTADLACRMLPLAMGALILAGCGPQSTAEDVSARSRPREFTLEYEFAVNQIPAGADLDGAVKVWVPMPAQTPLQTVSDLDVDLDLPYEILADDEYGNRYLYFTLDPESLPESGSISGAFSVRVRREPLTFDETATGDPGDYLETPRERFLQPDLLVPIGGRIGDEAQRVAAAGGTDLEKARLLYDHVVSTLQYDKSGEGWGRGDANYACDIRKGNCTDFHSLFIAEARSIGIPARFVMGLPLPPSQVDGQIGGYHCWAEFFVEDRGWLPIDASEASKDPGKKEKLFAGLDEHRVQFTVGRDIRLPGSTAGPVNYSIYPHAEIEGRWHGEVSEKFRFTDHPE